MRNLINIFKNKEQGLALIIVLIGVGVGGLLASVTVGFAGTVLKEHIITTRYFDRIYAADAGVEDALWCIKNNATPRTSLPQNINNASVSIEVLHTEGTYTLHAGQWVVTSGHSDWVVLDSTVIPIGEDNYRYVITISRTEASNDKVIWLEEVGAQIPTGYSYQIGTSSGLSSEDPVINMGPTGGYLLNWDFPKTKWDDNDPRTHVFDIQGSGHLEDCYGWVIGMSNDINIIGEFTGGFYTIIATATTSSDNKSTAIYVDVISMGSDLLVLSWQVVS